MSIAIKVENLSKAYQLGQIGTGTISRDLERWYARIRGKEDPFLKIGETNDQHSKSTSDVVWSLKDINFEIEQGDAVGIIGRNGAGKSTLLKILSKVTAPTTGRITGKGRIASLLEVGTGFHPELSGRENIFLNGAILGMRKKEIQRKLDEIVDFAGIERYLDTPVKRYSSGMYVRLAFAVAAHLESEILIVDEVLAVGDAEFQKKCLGKMGEVSKGEGRTVLFVSHNMDSIINLCSRGLLLSNGTLTCFPKIQDCVQYYLKSGLLDRNNIWASTKISNLPYIKKVEIDLKESEHEKTLFISATIKAVNNHPNAFIAFDIKNGMGNTVMQALPTLDRFINCNNTEKHFNFEVMLPGLIPDTYSISVWIGAHNDQTYDWQQDILTFEIITSPTKGRNFPHHYSNGSIVPESKLIQ